MAEAVDEGLSLLGEKGKTTVYYCLAKNYKLPKKEIPYRIDDFSKAIEIIFGTAAKIIQTIIMKTLFQKLNQPIKLIVNTNDLDFSNYVQSARIANISN